MARRTVSDDEILDAALRCVMDFGIRRATMTDVARAARISRVTLYRRYPDLETALAALMTREFAAVVNDARPPEELAPGRARTVAFAVEVTRRLAEHPLLLRIIDVDPELLLPYLTTRLGKFQEHAVAALREELAAGIADGSVRTGDPQQLAETVELALRGYVLSARARSARERKALQDELRRLVDGYLTPPV